MHQYLDTTATTISSLKPYHTIEEYSQNVTTHSVQQGTRAMLSQGGLRDAAVNLSLQRHRAVVTVTAMLRIK